MYDNFLSTSPSENSADKGNIIFWAEIAAQQCMLKDVRKLQFGPVYTEPAKR